MKLARKITKKSPQTGLAVKIAFSPKQFQEKEDPIFKIRTHIHIQKFSNSNNEVDFSKH